MRIETKEGETAMIELYREGVYLVNRTEIVPEREAARVSQLTGRAADKAEAAKGTIAYGILKAHNQNASMEKLKIKFDALASHDITYVGIIQTARASGMDKFPIPYVLTCCHNSLCAVGGTINEDDHVFGLSAAKNTAASSSPPTRPSSTPTCGSATPPPAKCCWAPTPTPATAPTAVWPLARAARSWPAS